MNADRSQLGSPRPDEAPKSSGSFRNAPTTPPIQPASPTPGSSRNLLFGGMALHTGFIDQKTLDNAIREQQTDPSQSLVEILVQGGTVSEEVRRLIERLCDAHIAQHGSDPQRSLESLTLAPTVSYRQPPGANTVTYLQKPPDSNQSQGTFGDYKVLGEIARGGMGRVLAAHDRILEREVALKILLPGASADRFVRESKITARLPHPGIPPVHALGTLDDGSPFLAMKLIVGKTLAEELKTADRPRLFQVFTQVCQAVGFAHSRGVIHRDLKPANIMVGALGEVQVMDWGLAKCLASREASGESHSLEALSLPIAGMDPNRITDRHAAGESTDDRTEAGTVMGTPAYMAPEQARGEVTDARADVFALGGILCAILTGQPPFTGKSSLDVIQRAASADLAEALARLDGCGADAELVALCRRCLSPDPVDRPADGQVVADALTAYLNGVRERLQAAERERAVTLAKATEQRKRRRVVASLSAVVVVILAVGSLIAVEMRNADRATALVDSLVSADVAQVPQIVAELEVYRRRTTPALVALAAQTPTTQDKKRAKLHARLALVTQDEQQVHPLVEELLVANVSYVGVIRDQLAPYHGQFQNEFWELLHDEMKDPTRRFRAGLALATYATTSEQWTSGDCTFLAEQLVAANPEHQQRLREYLRPLDNCLLVELERIFADPKASESHQLGAANALGDFAANDATRLARLLSAATPGQYAILFPLVAEARDVAARDLLNQLVREAPTADLPQLERVAWGQRRAGAAITLLRQGERESVLDVLRIQEDPESLTQFVHRCRQRGILPGQLLECLKLADQLRQPKMGEARRIEDRVLYALLMALGEFELAELPEAQRDTFVEQLANWCINDSSSAVHGATGWLLRHWKLDDLATKVDRTAVSYDPQREWFTLEFNRPLPGDTNQDQTFHITFVVFSPGEYLVGSPTDEADRQSNEQVHRVKLTRPIAVSDREVTWREFNSFDHSAHHNGWEKQFSRTLTQDEPVFGVTWYDAVSYCRWLSERAGVAEAEQAYAEPPSLDPQQFPADPDPQAGGKPLNWPVNVAKRGFRLPTEAEWEVACRSGTTSAYTFGNDVQLLGCYAWFLDNSRKWTHAVGQLRPNLRGLFDVQGNVYEWCHDWYGDNPHDAMDENPTGPSAGEGRVDRGGSYTHDATWCRSADRHRDGRLTRSSSLGFRVALVPFNETIQAASDDGSGSRETEAGAFNGPVPRSDAPQKRQAEPLALRELVQR